MPFHPQGYPFTEMYPGQHPAESALDHITAQMRCHSSVETKLSLIRQVTEDYFDHKAKLANPASFTIRYTQRMEVDEFERVKLLMDYPDSIFVFGSNLAGIHGAGAARAALDLYGAELGIGVGRAGRTYAVPTKDEYIKHPLPLSKVGAHVEVLLDYATALVTKWRFVVTRLGCGLAGFNDNQIAPLFRGAPANCKLPIGWREFNGEPDL